MHFLHFCIFCIGLVDKCVFFRIFLRFFCIPRHPLVTCFCVFCAFFSGLVLHYFCIVYAFFMFCCVIRTSFSVHPFHLSFSSAHPTMCECLDVSGVGNDFSTRSCKRLGCTHRWKTSDVQAAGLKRHMRPGSLAPSPQTGCRPHILISFSHLSHPSSLSPSRARESALSPPLIIPLCQWKGATNILL